MQPRLGERSTPNSLVLTVRTSHDKSLSFKGPQHAAEITGVNSQAATNLPKQSSLVHWPTSLQKPVAEGTDALRDCSVETADFLNRCYLYFSDHSQRLSPNYPKQATGLHDGNTRSSGAFSSNRRCSRQLAVRHLPHIGRSSSERA